MKKLLCVLLVLLAVVPCAFGKSYVDEITDMTYAEAQKLNTHLQEVPFLMVHCECCEVEEYSDVDNYKNFGIMYILNSEIRKSTQDYTKSVIKIKYKMISAGWLNPKSQIESCEADYTSGESEELINLNMLYTVSMSKTLLVGEFLNRNMEEYKCKKNPIKFPDARMCGLDGDGLYEKWYADTFRSVALTKYETDYIEMQAEKNKQDSIANAAAAAEQAAKDAAAAAEQASIDSASLALALVDAIMKAQGVNKNSNMDFLGNWTSITKNNYLGSFSISTSNEMDINSDDEVYVMDADVLMAICDEYEGYLIANLYVRNDGLNVGAGILYRDGVYLIYMPINYGKDVIKFRR